MGTFGTAFWTASAFSYGAAAQLALGGGATVFGVKRVAMAVCP
jgi:hypothetical protein